MNRQNTTFKPLAKSAPKGSLNGFTPDSRQVAEILPRIKRQQPDGSPSPSSYQSQGNCSPPANLIYLQNKHETEQSKMGACISTDHSDSPETRNYNDNCTQQQSVENDLLQDPRLAGGELQDSALAAGNAVPADPHKDIRDSWKDRFLKLQMLIKTCDQSNQEDYIQMLRSLSAVGRNKHAVDLEKRAIHLLLEEGKELQRMKVLNVMGKP